MVAVTRPVGQIAIAIAHVGARHPVVGCVVGVVVVGLPVVPGAGVVAIEAVLAVERRIDTKAVGVLIPPGCPRRGTREACARKNKTCEQHGTHAHGALPCGLWAVPRQKKTLDWLYPTYPQRRSTSPVRSGNGLPFLRGALPRRHNRTNAAEHAPGPQVATAPDGVAEACRRNEEGH